jgi:hypothetical protein
MRNLCPKHRKNKPQHEKDTKWLQKNTNASRDFVAGLSDFPKQENAGEFASSGI